jgi:ABC-type polysaccharide/polyol phosphate export permease
MVTGGIVLALTVPLGFRVSHVNAPVVVITLVLTLLVFMGIGNIGSSVVLAFQQGGQLVAALFLLLGVLGGALFPVAEFPASIRPVTWLSPLTYSLSSLRSALLAHQPHTSYTLDLLVLAGFAVVVLPLSGFVLDLAFRYAQRRGTFSTF